MLVQFGRAGLLGKVLQQPDKARQVFDKLKSDGVVTTARSVRDKLKKPITPGYSSAGIVLKVGTGVKGFSVGDRVVTNGPHAEMVCVPSNLCARIPDAVSDESAAFTVLTAVALQSVRLLQPTIGEIFAVSGLGLIGLLTVQILRAQGCKVLALDPHNDRCALAEKYGAISFSLADNDKPLAAARHLSKGHGLDGVIIAAATSSNEPVHMASSMCRKRGRIILVGVTGLKLDRDDFYKKELTFQVSCSYGPGRYDLEYENKRQDYPVGYVRWTAQRNFEAVLELMANGHINVADLVSHRFPIDDAALAYSTLLDESSLGIVLEYPVDDSGLRRSRQLKLPAASVDRKTGDTRVAVVGAGNYGSRVLVPALQRTDARLISIVSQNGVSSMQVGTRFGFQTASTDPESVIRSDGVNAIIIATRHDSHANLVCQALTAGKNVFVEKPIAIRREELNQIARQYSDLAKAGSAPVLMVGMNRRFAPHIERLKLELAKSIGPKTFVYTVNAGALPTDHWLVDEAIGGGRIVGEACHFVDLLRFLADSAIAQVVAVATNEKQSDNDQSASITIKFKSGSIGTIHYVNSGHAGFPKERLQIFWDGSIAEVDNFRKMRTWGVKGLRTMNLMRQDKGNRQCIQAFVDAVEGCSPSPIAFDQIAEVACAVFDAADQLRAGT